jgi:UDP-glucose 4-epimerase
VPQNLVPYITQTAIGLRKELSVYGNDYPTPDGTCIRDYIHVEDLADAHIISMEQQIPGGIYNLGTNAGKSNFAVVQLAAQIVGQDIPTLHGPKREGDPAVLTADAGKFMGVSTWQPKYTLQDIIAHAWSWYH